MRKALFIIAILASAFAVRQTRKVTIYLIGDSTMSEKRTEAYPETGWGMPFRYFFDSTVLVKNLAQNGRSTKTFLAENRWQPVTDNLKEGDFVLIQFGHNDEVVTKASYTTPDEFVANLTRYINETRAKKGIPILITPVARRKFDSLSNKLLSTHEQYSALVRATAQINRVPLIDLDKLSQDYLVKLGPDDSKFLYNWLEVGEHPNYPKGVKDDTHFNELGARKMAEIVLQEIKRQGLGMAQYVVKK